MCVESSGGLLGGLFKGKDSAMEDPSRETEVAASGLSHTILRFGRILDRLGGNTYIEMSQGNELAPGAIAREDAALVAVRCLSFVPPAGQGVVCSVGGAGPGTPPSGEDWSELFNRLQVSSQ